MISNKKLTTTKNDFIVIDDDPVNNRVCYKMLQLCIPGSAIFAFTDAEEGMNHVSSAYNSDSDHAVVFLDIEMPRVSGWETLAKLEALPPALKDRLDVYILSSSVDPLDRQSADEHAYVKAYITKPLTFEKLKHYFPARMAS